MSSFFRCTYGARPLRVLNLRATLLGREEVGEVRAHLIVAVAMEAPDGGVLDHAILLFDLAVRPGMVGLGQPMLNAVGLADQIGVHRRGVYGVAVPGLLGELNAVISENGVGHIGDSVEQVLKELPFPVSVSCGNELSDGELGRPVDSHNEKELALGDVDVEEAKVVALELLPLGLVAFHIWQTRDAILLQAPMKR